MPEDFTSVDRVPSRGAHCPSWAWLPAASRVDRGTGAEQAASPSAEADAAELRCLPLLAEGCIPPSGASRRSMIPRASEEVHRRGVRRSLCTQFTVAAEHLVAVYQRGLRVPATGTMRHSTLPVAGLIWRTRRSRQRRTAVAQSPLIQRITLRQSYFCRVSRVLSSGSFYGKARLFLLVRIRSGRVTHRNSRRSDPDFVACTEALNKGRADSGSSSWLHMQWRNVREGAFQPASFHVVPPVASVLTTKDSSGGLSLAVRMSSFDGSLLQYRRLTAAGSAHLGCLGLPAKVR